VTGTVQKVNSNFGFVRGDGDSVQYFFHGSALLNCALSDVHVGSRLRFEEEGSTRGPRACRVELLAT
jgi:cold shock CspA family protein